MQNLGSYRYVWCNIGVPKDNSAQKHKQSRLYKPAGCKDVNHTNRHVLVAQFLPLILAAMVKNDVDRGKPALELVNPVGQGGQRAHHHKGSIDLLPPEMAQKSNGLHLQPVVACSAEA